MCYKALSIGCSTCSEGEASCQKAGGVGVLCLVLWNRLWKHHFNYRAWEVAKIYAAKLVAEGVLSESEVAEPWAPKKGP